MSLNLIGLIGIAFTFGVAIFVHEFGHFLLAKLMKVPVATFSFGFGKKILKYKWGETVYAIGIIPFGGYVQLGKLAPTGDTADKPMEVPPEGAEPGEITQESKQTATGGMLEDLAALGHLPYLAKVAIFAAGVCFNYLTAIIVLTLMFTIGFTVDAPWEAKIGEIRHPLISEKFGLQVNDQIVAINNNPVKDWVDVENLVNEHFLSKPDKALVLTIQRGEERYTLEIPLFLDDKQTSSVMAYINPPIPPYIGKLLPNLPAEKSGLRNGDMVLAINDREISSWTEMTRIIRQSPNKPLRFKINRNNNIVEIEVKPRPNPKNPNQGEIGVLWGNPKKTVEQIPFPSSLFQSVKISVVMMKFLGVAVYDLIKNANFAVVRENIGGPVAIAILSYKAAQSGWAEFFNFFAVLNLLLFMFNILPLPILDGGHILIVSIETIIRRRIPPKILVRIFSIMLILIITLFVWVTLNDILMNLWRFGFRR